MTLYIDRIFQLTNGNGLNIQTISDILDANRLILESIEGKTEGHVDESSRINGQVVLGKDVLVEKGIIRGPSIIGQGSEIIDSYIGPFTSVQENCRIIRSEIECSIVMERSEIKDAGSRIDESLIGRAKAGCNLYNLN